jgi:hypothetical protein
MPFIGQARHSNLVKLVFRKLKQPENGQGRVSGLDGFIGSSGPFF